MSNDLFISYAWTSDTHRNWVRLFASHLHLLGYTVLIDEKLDYGSSLNGFMRTITECNRALLIVDENYVYRADNNPESGVGIESSWLEKVYKDKPANWLSVIFLQNPKCHLPCWLQGLKPKGFNFNFSAKDDNFPGAWQIEEVWRWLEGLPADRNHASELSLLRRRAARLERVEIRCDPAYYANPSLQGVVTFLHDEHPYYTVGYGDLSFKLAFSGSSNDSIHALKDYELQSIGIVHQDKCEPGNLERFLTKRRPVTPNVGQTLVVQNNKGAICTVTINKIRYKDESKPDMPGEVIFTYNILADE